MNEEHHIGILLNSSRLTKVAQLRTFALESLTVFHITRQLRQGEYRNVELLGKPLERTGNCRNLFLTATKLHSVGVHQLKIVYHKELHTLFSYQSACLGSQFEN